jgi:hypothetical protein
MPTPKGWPVVMDLTVNNRIIAAIDIRPVQLARLLGAFELVIPFSGIVHAAADGIHRSLTIAGARIAMRGKNGQIVQVGRAVPDNGTIARQYDNPTRLDFALKLPLQPYQLEACQRRPNFPQKRRSKVPHFRRSGRRVGVAIFRRPTAPPGHWRGRRRSDDRF